MSLTKIQAELNVPKNQKNEFGGYMYRSCEDILEAVKPLLDKYNCNLHITDSITEVGGRVYVVATAVFNEAFEKGEQQHFVRVEGYAREPQSKKGMDESQITGAASSYARKYALAGLFLIDDTKDPDADDNSGQSQQIAKQPPNKGVDNQNIVERQLTAQEVDKKWNGKLYGNCVFIDNVKIKPPADQVEKLKTHTKYKP